MARFRALKKELSSALAHEDWRKKISAMNVEPDILVNPLLALRLHREEIICWRAVEALGEAVAQVAEARIEQARIHMRTFMWFMNEESGNLGWGIPEAMAVAMVKNEKLAAEYHSILASYIYNESDCDGNYLDHPELRRGVFWGLAYLATAAPNLVVKAVKFITNALMDEDSGNRGLAAMTLGVLASKNHNLPPDALHKLNALQSDKATVRVYRNDKIEESSVGQLALDALSHL